MAFCWLIIFSMQLSVIYGLFSHFPHICHYKTCWKSKICIKIEGFPIFRVLRKVQNKIGKKCIFHIVITKNYQIGIYLVVFTCKMTYQLVLHEICVEKLWTCCISRWLEGQLQSHSFRVLFLWFRLLRLSNSCKRQSFRFRHSVQAKSPSVFVLLSSKIFSSSKRS